MTEIEHLIGPPLGTGLAALLVTLGEDPARLELTTMVGDRRHDVDAGRAHRLTTVAVTWGMGSVEELADADQVVHTPEELVAVLT